MNSQWKLVPVEPTETMVINGFESVPNECFTDVEVWEQYQEMSGCQQAAFRAKLCWAAMIASAPTPPTEAAQPEGALHIVQVLGTIVSFGETLKEVSWTNGTMPEFGIELVDRAHVTRLTAERDALQQRLNAADQRIDELVAELAKVRLGPCKMIVGDELP